MSRRTKQALKTRQQALTHGVTAPVFLGLIGVVALSNGCGMSRLGHGVGLPNLGITAKTPSRDDKLGDARAQSVALPREPFWPYRLGQLYLEADSTANAEAALAASLKRDPSYAPALTLLSKLYYESGRHAAAVTMLEAARAAGPVPPAAAKGLALHYDALHQPDRARAIIKELSLSDRDREDATNVFLALRGEDPDAATKSAAAAVERNGRSAVHQNNYGITRLRAGDVAAARRAFAAAIELDPELPGPYYNLTILEKYYALDDSAAAHWFSLHRARSSDDPDHLAESLGQVEKKPLAGARKEP